jgi:hypothetical protein
VKTVVQELIEEQAKNTALEAKLKAAQADAAKARIDAAKPTATALGTLTAATAAAEYAQLKTADEKKAYRVKNWRILGCNEER